MFPKFVKIQTRFSFGKTDYYKNRERGDNELSITLAPKVL